MFEILLSMSTDRTGLFISLIGLFFFALLWFFLISLYIYTNIYIKEICRIVYKDEKKFKRLIEPFDFYYLSMLPSAYWREILNIKLNTSFKAHYGKNVYQKIGESQLNELLKNYPVFFYIHYLIILLGILGICLLFLGVGLEKYIF
jgi:hypothetical protein